MDRPLAAFDIETIPDPAVGRRVMGLEGDDRAVIEAMLERRREETDGRTDFHPAPFHRVVAISVAWLAPDQGRFKLGTLGSSDPLDEVGHLDAFFGLFRRAPEAPRLVSWNGNGFDLPVIRYRAMLHGLAVPELYRTDGPFQWNNYQNRFHDMHVDLMDVLAGFGASERVRLDQLCRIVGLPGKTVTEGHRVYTHILRGEAELVRQYCELDALNTLLLYLLWSRHRGRVEAAAVRRLVALIVEQLRTAADKAAWLSYADALEGWPQWPEAPPPAS